VHLMSHAVDRHALGAQLADHGEQLRAVARIVRVVVVEIELHVRVSRTRRTECNRNVVLVESAIRTKV
jgi:hypothetical protein